jgi:hypothetical protein
LANDNEKSAAQIFSEIGAAIAKQDTFDADLAKIIRESILVVGDEEDAVTNALEAIQTVARKRAGIEE